MANYSQLKTAIAAVIKTNNRNEITGQLLQNVLFEMTGSIGENMQLAGFADPLTDPHEPDQNLFYLAEQSGVYTHFDNIVLDGGLSFLMWKNGSWTSRTVGVVTQQWVEDHYVSIEFFRSLFRAYDEDGVEILPNNVAAEGELPAVVENIKAVVGLWTEQYLSALGRATGGSGGGGVTSLAMLDDVSLTEPLTDGQALVYDILTGKWVNGSAGVDMAAVWSALAGNTGEQINASHLTTALADYATQTWVETNYISVAYFDRLFRAYNGTTLVAHNDTTSTINNIKAMFGFWTDMYLTALGNHGTEMGLTLNNLNDVLLTNAAAGDVLTYDAVSGKWVNQQPQAGVTSLSALSDVALTSVEQNNILVYNDILGKWVNTSVKTVNGYSIFGSGNIDSGSGTGNYVSKGGDTMSGLLKINYGATSGGQAGSQGLWIARSVNVQPHYGATVTITAYNNQGLYLTGQYYYGGLGFYDGTFNTVVYISRNLNVGIGNSAPSEKLDVSGNAKVSGRMYVSDIRAVTMEGLLTIYPTDWGGVNSNEWAVGSLSANGVIRGKNYLYFSDQNNYRYDIITGKGGTINGRLVINIDNDAEANNYDSGSMRIGTATGNHLLLDGNEIVAANYTSTSSLYLQNNGGDLLACIQGGNVGIGKTSPSYKLHVSGTIYATGAITALSDIRKKDVQESDIGLTVERIALAPTIKFLWKEKREEGLQVGSIAQYWQNVLPEVVSDKGGELSMQYGVTALISSIVTARKVVDHERRITELEKENERLRTEIEQLRLN